MGELNLEEYVLTEHERNKILESFLKKKQMTAFKNGGYKTSVTTVTGKKKDYGYARITYYLYFYGYKYGRKHRKGADGNCRFPCSRREYKAAQIGDELIFINFGEKNLRNKIVLKKMLQ